MDARAIIVAIRDGTPPSPEALRWFAQGLADGTVTDAQAGAFAMAVLLKGLGEPGRVALTTGMRDSGKVLQWDMPGPVLDKHSTGGIGDCVSLLLAPALAASFFLSVTFSWDEFIIAFLLRRFDVTLPVEIWSMLRSGLSPATNAVGALVFLVSVTLVTVPDANSMTCSLNAPLMRDTNASHLPSGLMAGDVL